MNNDLNEKKGNRNSKRIFITVTLILLLIISTTGATYAYFAISASNSTVVTGTTAEVGLTLDVREETLKTPNTGVMVPQLATAIGSAINTTNKCVDGNGNIVCKVYEITITNNSTAAIEVNGTISFASGTNGVALASNLKWRRTESTTALASATTGSYAAAGVTAAAATTDLIAGTACTVGSGTDCTSVSLGANGSQKYYIVVWINEISTGDQYGVDGNRTFVGTIAFTASNGKGVTSTITS